jgi:hypothetical protein
VSAFESISSFFDRSAPPGPPVAEPDLAPDEAALVAEACSRSGVVWLRAAAQPYRLAWHVWHEDAVVVVQGGGEQELGLPVAPGSPATVELVVPSKDRGTRLATALTRAEVLDPATPEWAAAAAALSAARLNDRDAAGQRTRWAASAQLVSLTPLRLLAAGPGHDATPSGAAPVPGGPATTTRRTPWHLGGRARRRG